MEFAKDRTINKNYKIRNWRYKLLKNKERKEKDKKRKDHWVETAAGLGQRWTEKRY